MKQISRKQMEDMQEIIWLLVSGLAFATTVFSIGWIFDIRSVREKAIVGMVAAPYYFATTFVVMRQIKKFWRKAGQTVIEFEDSE